MTTTAGQADSTLPPIVLVPGAWHGAWCWTEVSAILRAAGHDVHSVTLTGLADRSHLASPQVGLRLHATDLVSHLRWHDLHDVVLVGHSYAGFVVREAADRSPDRVRVVTLLDAWLGKDGDSLASQAPSWFTEALTSAAEREGFGWLCPAPSPDLVGVHDDRIAERMRRLLTPQPLLTFLEPTRLTGAVDRLEHRAAVCTDGIGLPFAELAAQVDGDAVRIESGHDAMLVAPEAVARFILGAAT